MQDSAEACILVSEKRKNVRYYENKKIICNKRYCIDYNGIDTDILS